MDEAIFLAGSIPSQLTVGYEQVRHGIIEQVNGHPIRRMADLETGFNQPQGGLHVIQLSEAPYTLYLDANNCQHVDNTLLQQGLPALQRIHPQVPPAEETASEETPEPAAPATSE